jgi:hypothetical protein
LNLLLKSKGLAVRQYWNALRVRADEHVFGRCLNLSLARIVCDVSTRRSEPARPFRRIVFSFDPTRSLSHPENTTQSGLLRPVVTKLFQETLYSQQ